MTGSWEPLQARTFDYHRSQYSSELRDILYLSRQGDGKLTTIELKRDNKDIIRRKESGNHRDGDDELTTNELKSVNKAELRRKESGNYKKEDDERSKNQLKSKAASQQKHETGMTHVARWT